jgi:hypothetical protein
VNYGLPHPEFSKISRNCVKIIGSKMLALIVHGMGNRMIHLSRKFKDQRYDHSPLGKARRDRYAKSEKGRATRKRYEQSAKRRAVRARYNAGQKGRASRQRCALPVWKRNNPLPTSPLRGDWMQDFRGGSLNER